MLPRLFVSAPVRDSPSGLLGVDGAGSLSRFLSLDQLNPNPVRVLYEGLTPAEDSPDGSRAHDDFDTLLFQSLDCALKVVDFEAKMVQFFAIHVWGPEPTAVFVPVQFQELGRTGTAKSDSLSAGRLVAFKRVHDFHAENLGVKPHGALDISDPKPRVHKAERHATGSRERDLIAGVGPVPCAAG